MVINILFVTEVEISPIQGGTEHITHTLSQSFRFVGHRCSLAYLCPISSDLQPTEFDSKIQLECNENLSSQLSDFIQKQGIMIVIVNLVKKDSKKAILPVLFRETRKNGAKIIACYHAMPGEDIKPSNWAHIFYQVRHNYNLKQACKDAFLHISPQCLNKRLIRSKYQFAPQYCDVFILLSTKFYKPYIEYAGKINQIFFYAIPNALSYSKNIEFEKIKDKRHTILIVARQHERSKKLSFALKVWKSVEEAIDLKDWKLQIVGGGPDEDYYKYLHKKLGLQRCELLGRQKEIIPFYERASIFMMTSSYEGFGITLTEAQQFGCVPIVLNSYASLIDIIQNGENGVIVDNINEEEFARKLMRLMRNKEDREQMAYNGLASCQRFSQERITQQWLDLFDNLLK